MLYEWFGELTEEQRAQKIKQAFRNVLQTEDGQIVFHFIFETLYFFRKAETPEAQALNNYAKFLLVQIGEDAIYRVIETLLNTKEARDG